MELNNGYGYWKMAMHCRKNNKKLKDYNFNVRDNGEDKKLSCLNSNINEKKRIISILEIEFQKKHSKGGRKPKLSIEDKLNATIEYMDSNITFLELAQKYDIHESNMYDSIIWVIKTLEDKKILFRNKG